MKLNQRVINQFNSSETLAVISSFPKKGGELARDNAVAWYSQTLLSNFPKTKNIIVFTNTSSGNREPRLYSRNILVIPCYPKNNVHLYRDCWQQIKKFLQVRQFLVQHEFGSFGHKLNSLSIVWLLSKLKKNDKHITVGLHQIVNNSRILSRHINISTFNPLHFLLNFGFRLFYQALNLIADDIVVFNISLKKKLIKITNSKNISVIPFGMESKELTKKSFAKSFYYIDKNEFVVLAFGYRSWFKGTDWISKQIVEISKKYPQKKIRLLIAGQYSKTVKNKRFNHSLEEIVTENPAIITSVGYVPQNQLDLCFSAADLVIYPYRGLISNSASLSQTISYGKPFLISEPLKPTIEMSPLLNILNKHNLKISNISFKFNHRSLENKLINVINNAELKKSLENASKAMRKTSSWKKVVSQYQSLLNDQKNKNITPENISQTKLYELSIFFPLHNEEKNIDNLVKQVRSHLPLIAKKYEVILVDDGSTDSTLAKCKFYAKKYRNIRLVHQKNGGYGKALQAGFNNAKYDWIFFTDGDLQFNLKDLQIFIPYTQTYDAVFGYRINRADPWHRLILAKILKIWNHVFFSLPNSIKDVDCAYKLIHRSRLVQISPLLSHGAMISTEMILKLIDNEVSIAQVGVSHYPRRAGNSTGAKLNVIVGAIKETINILLARSRINSDFSLSEVNNTL